MDQACCTAKLPNGEGVEFNIDAPSLEYYKPDNANGTAVMLIPGGGLYALLSDSEGSKIASWLTARGVSVFLLRHSLKKSLTNNPVQDIFKYFSLQSDYIKVLNDPIFAKAAADASDALKYIRRCTFEYNIDPEKIGIMGFSTGAAIAFELQKSYSKGGYARPGFIISINGFSNNGKTLFPSAAGSVFLSSISVTALHESAQSSKLFEKLNASYIDVELHIFETSFEESPGAEDWKQSLEMWMKKHQLCQG